MINKTTQEKINILERQITELKEILFSSFDDEEKDYLIFMLEKEILFLINGENITQLDMLECNQYDC